MSTIKGTRDIYLSALFLALGAEYEGADKTDPKHIEFHFVPRKASTGALANIENLTTQDLDAIESQWVNGTATVNAVKYADALKRMKSIVHSK